VKRILVATDGSPAARAAVGEALALARRLGAEVVFVSVRHAIPIIGDPYYQSLLTRQLQECRDALESALAAARDAGVPADTDVLEGAPPEAILAAAVAQRADLVVVGSRGRGTLGKLLLGSTSQALVEHAEVPVLVVREPGTKEARAA
jgi:nucleotide-binding universal stress UspA family protein